MAAAATSSAQVLKHVEQADLIHYGLIPEFVGRFPVICSLQVRFFLPVAFVVVLLVCVLCGCGWVAVVR